MAGSSAIAFSKLPAEARNIQTEQAPYNLPLRIAALTAGILIIPLRAINSPETGVVFMTLFFYLGAYLVVAVLPPKWAGAQAGFSVGYSLSMQAALGIILLFQIGFPSISPAELNYFHITPFANLALLLVGLITWVWNRKRIHNVSAFAMLFCGIIYPFAAFFVEMIIAGSIYR